jgi:alpha/beta superfamily hydrolase
MGVYALADLRRFLAFSGEPEDAGWTARWLKTALNPVDHGRWQADYSFSDLVSLFVVRELHRRGVRLSDIRKAENYLRKLWKTDRSSAINPD